MIVRKSFKYEACTADTLSRTLVGVYNVEFWKIVLLIHIPAYLTWKISWSSYLNNYTTGYINVLHE
jgi:hypothetical protein